ncbi:DUF814 domain-containing protein [Candidatus Pacearchaeota archaeon]|nr:DUF814 domain-containing protein [Candidatus Pacearchaeota archaeon]
MKFREIFLGKNKRILLGKDRHSNDELMKEFEGKSNIILHTETPGSPFGVIDFQKPTKKDIYFCGIFVARFSQNWRENKQDVKINVFTGKDIAKIRGMEIGTWKVKKAKRITIKKRDLLNADILIKKNDAK